MAELVAVSAGLLGGISLLFQDGGRSCQLLGFELSSAVSFAFPEVLSKMSRLLVVMTNFVLVLVSVIARWFLTLLLELGNIAFGLFQVRLQLFVGFAIIEVMVVCLVEGAAPLLSIIARILHGSGGRRELFEACSVLLIELRILLVALLQEHVELLQ